MKMPLRFLHWVSIRRNTGRIWTSSLIFSDRRQSGLGSFTAKPAKVEKLKPLLRTTAKRERLWYGPYTLPALNVSYV
jgi:hypothetical protein